MGAHVKPHGELVLSLTKDHPEQAEANHIARASALAISIVSIIRYPKQIKISK
jgi:hypothetical protein